MGGDEVADGSLSVDGDVGGLAEDVHAVVAFNEVVEGSYAVGGGRVDGVALDIGGNEVTVGGNDEGCAADGLSAGTGNRLEKSRELLAGEGGKGEAVLEGEGAIDIADGDVAFLPHVAYAAVVGYGQSDGRAISCIASGAEDVGLEVVHEPLRASAVDVEGGCAEDRSLDVDDLLAILGEDGLCLGVLRKGVDGSVDLNERAADGDCARRGGGARE